ADPADFCHQYLSSGVPIPKFAKPRSANFGFAALVCVAVPSVACRPGKVSPYMHMREIKPIVRKSMRSRLMALMFAGLFLAAPANAAPCGGDFNAFLAAMARDA